MNIKLISIITILVLFFILGFGQISYSLNKVSANDISELKILKYLPKNSKLLFISNTKSSKIIDNVRKNYDTNDQDKLFLIKDSLLGYLGLDIGKNKLEEIYNNELTITTYDNKEKDIDDILIIFKIKKTKDINDVLNLTDDIYEPNKLIKIYRDNKLNYLKYIYQTNDNYIISSTKKNLILDALESGSFNEENETKYESFKKLLKNFKNEKNILLKKNFKLNELKNNEKYNFDKYDYLLTLFNFKDNEILLKSYLVNFNKSLDIPSYTKINDENLLDKKNYQIITYNDLLDSNEYLNQVNINTFEKSIIKELNEKLYKNLLFFSF